MPRQLPPQFGASPGDWLLHVAGNIVGILVILVVVAGARARQYSAPAAIVDPEEATALSTTLREAEAIEADAQHISRQMAALDAEAAQRYAERSALQALMSAAERELAERRGALDADAQRQYDLQRSTALARLESVMKVKSAYATAHMPDSPKPAAKPSAYAKPAPAPAKRDDDAQAKQAADAKASAEAAKKQTEARERLEKARADAEAKAEAKKKEEASERLEKARAEAEQRQSEAKEAKAKAEAEAAEAKEEAARKEAEAKAAASAPKYTQFIAEHTVQPGDNLSFISERYYGTQANFRIIYEANREVIGDNMSLIRPGQLLKIPKL